MLDECRRRTPRSPRATRKESRARRVIRRARSVLRRARSRPPSVILRPARCPRTTTHRQAEPLDERRVIRGVRLFATRASRARARSSRAENPAASARARAAARSTVRTMRPLSSTSLSVSTHRQRRHRALAVARRGDHAVDRLVVTKRARGIVHEHDPHFRRACPRGRSRTRSPRSRPPGYEQPVHVALEQPRRRIAAYALRQHARPHVPRRRAP